MSKFYERMHHAMKNHRYWLAKMLDQPRSVDGELVTIHCNKELLEKLEQVRDNAEEAIKKVTHDQCFEDM